MKNQNNNVTVNAAQVQAQPVQQTVPVQPVQIEQPQAATTMDPNMDPATMAPQMAPQAAAPQVQYQQIVDPATGQTITVPVQPVPQAPGLKPGTGKKILAGIAAVGAAAGAIAFAFVKGKNSGLVEGYELKKDEEPSNNDNPES